jgi:hypothetical protein
MSRSPFPGMDPYLESPKLWPSVHHRLITVFADQLSPLLAPKYFADLESYIVIDQISEKEASVVPDVLITDNDENEFDNSEDDLESAVAIAPAPVRLTIPMQVPTRLTNIYVKQSENEKWVTVLELLSPVNC